MKMLMRLLFAASICLLIACTATAMPPSVDHTDNYTVVLSYGQTPYQIGYRASGNVTAWNWWDTGEGMQQQNLILAMVLDKTAHPVGGLSPPSFSLSQTRFRAGLNTYSWKADDDGTGNYSNNMDIWHWVPLNLTEHSNPELTFYTWYKIAPGDYGYVKVSTDDGKTWTELASYTGDQTGMLDEEEISLNAYCGKDILLAFNFVSDSSGVNEGWYIDDIKVVAGGIQFFNWRLFGSTIFKDGATSTPPELVVDVSYPSYYSTRTETIKLQEYSKGLYGGIFYYATNETYSGRYEINFTNEVNGTDPASVVTAFDTTLWGCQASNCHDAWSPTNDPSNRTLTDVIHPDNITSSTATNCLTACHTPSASQFLRATPVHLHEIVYGHYGGFICGEAGWIEIFNKTNVNIQMYRDTSVKRPLVQGAFNQPSHASASAPVGCIDCHTKFVHDKTGGVSYQVALQTLHGTNITYGVHSNVSCEKCHGNLSYPKFTGDTSLPGTLNDYVPEFMSYEESTETYIIDVGGVSGINVTVVAEDTDHEFLLSLIGPVDNTTTGLGGLNRSDPWRGTYLLPSVDGTAIFRAGGKICYPYGEYLNVVTFDSGSPEQGTWVARILARSTGQFNYTITSNYDITRKPIIHIPWNCSECHQASPPAGCEGAETGLTIPDWDNYGLAYTHTDIGDDGSDDVTCRACHNALHDVGILDCVNCHRSPPPGHENFVFDYQSASYSVCVGCHRDPHYEPELAAGGNCTDCHLTGGANTTGIRVIINDTGFFKSVHRNITGDFDPLNYTAISRVCWGCHNNYSQQLIDPKHIEIKPDCEDCHDSQTPLNGDHIDPPQVREHQPDGDDITTNATIANCTICHNKSLVTDMPPDENVRSKNPRNYISHYGRQRTDIIVDSGNASNCSYCHCDEENMFNVTFENRNNTNITHGIGFAVNCTDCHGYGRIHDAAISSPTMVPGNNSLCMNTACHSNPSKPWFVDISAFNSGIHSGANCTDCHTALPIAVDGDIKSGGTYHHSFDVHKDTKQMNVTLNWVSGSLNLTLDANGTEINSSVAATDPDIEYIPSGNSIRYVITNPVNGPWIASVSDVSTTTRFDLSIDFIFRHPKHDQCYTNPCDSCHVTNISYNAPPIAEHVTEDTPIDAEVWTEASCTDCHRNYITYPSSIIAAGVDRSNIGAMSAHYGVPDVLDTRDCISCHENEDIGREWGDAPDPREIVRYEYVENASDTSDTYRTGEVWRLKNEYEIVVGPVSSTGSSVWIDLAHNGASVQRELVSEGGVFEYEIKKDWIKSKSNADDPLNGTKHETYKHRKSGKSSYTTIVDLKVDDIFTSGMMGVVTFKGLIIKSRIHVETENKPCYTCHVDGYRYYAPEDGDSYVVLRNAGADGDHSDSDDITIGRLPINFTEREHRMQYVQTGWDLGYGYLLQITEIDLVGRKALVELSKDGMVLQREVVPEGEMFRYNTTITDKEGHTMNNVTVFEMRIAEVFRR